MKLRKWEGMRSSMSPFYYLCKFPWRVAAVALPCSAVRSCGTARIVISTVCFVARTANRGKEDLWGGRGEEPKGRRLYDRSEVISAADLFSTMSYPVIDRPKGGRTCSRSHPGVSAMFGVLTNRSYRQYTWACLMPPVESARPIGRSESLVRTGCRCPNWEPRSGRSAQPLRRKRSSGHSISPSFSVNLSTERERCWVSRSRRLTLNGDEDGS